MLGKKQLAQTPFVNLHEILRFQEQVLEPILVNSRLSAKLQTHNWMGLKQGGVTLKDLPPAEAEQLVRLLGPAAFKVLRVSTDLLKQLQAARRDGRPIVTSGGSCLLTTADKNQLKEAPLSPTELVTYIQNLPHLMQIFDASLPLHCADQYVNIIEDSLFAELAQECSVPALPQDELLKLFQAEGENHCTGFQTWQWAAQSGAIVTPANFSELPVAEASQEFWLNTEVLGHIRHYGQAFMKPEVETQLQVMFSFTGVWANMLREEGLIPTDCCYLVVEPFHHFTEAALRDQRVKRQSDRWNLYAGFDNLMTQAPYGQEGVNQGVQGGIAFLPAITPQGQLGHTNLLLEECCHPGNFEAYLAKLRETLSARKVPVPHDNELFVDAVNYLFHQPDCREAMIWLMQQTLSLREQANRVTRDKKERKTLLKKLRSHPDILNAALDRYRLLYQELDKLVNNIFS